jgi:hypothetical protein
MPKVNFGTIPDQQDFTPLPLGKYPCLLRVTNIAKASDGQVMTDGDGNPALLRSNDGSEKWDLNALILGGAHVGREIRDNLVFSEKGIKKVKPIFVRAGIVEGNETYDCQPNELNETFWWVEIDKHEQGKNKDNTLKVTKDGKPKMYHKVAFAGYTLMQPAEAKKYRAEYDAWLAKKGGGARPVVDEGAGDDEVPF